MLLRVLFVSFVTTFISEFINIYIISKWKILLRGKYYWLRSLGSSGVGVFVYAFIASFISFVGILPVRHIFNLALSAYMFNQLILIALVFFGVPLVFFLKKTENL